MNVPPGPSVDHQVPLGTRAGNGTRTRDPNLGKVVLYQLSYSRVTALLCCCPHRPADRSDPAVEARGIEPLTS